MHFISVRYSHTHWTTHLESTDADVFMSMLETGVQQASKSLKAKEPSWRIPALCRFNQRRFFFTGLGLHGPIILMCVRKNKAGIRPTTNHISIHHGYFLLYGDNVIHYSWNAGIHTHSLWKEYGERLSDIVLPTFRIGPRGCVLCKCVLSAKTKLAEKLQFVNLQLKRIKLMNNDNDCWAKHESSHFKEMRLHQ